MQGKIFISSLRSDVTYEDLYTFLANYGMVKKLTLIFDKKDKKKCKGFGFVEFMNNQIKIDLLAQSVHF
jgi:RNA recognition motif-containing protein